MDNHSARKLQRQRLIEARHALADREKLEATLRSHVLDWLRQENLQAIGFYFPIRGEPDLRPVIADWLRPDATRVAALPVIDGPALQFHAWTEDAPLQAGEYDIPVPAHGRIVQPQCLLIPCVGFDRERFRLGYGGGYYDRTLATLMPRPLAVGIAFDAARLDCIQPQQHDVQLDVVITESRLYY